MKNKILYIRGCGGHAKSVADVALFNNPSLHIVFVDDNANPNEKIFNFHVIKQMPKDAEIIHHAFGDNQKRKQFQHENSISIISKNAYISPTAKINSGTFIAHHAHVGPNAIIGKSSIINTSSIIEHEVIIGDFSHISVNATVCGKCQIGDNVFFGAAAVIKDHIKICSNVTLGAGSVVIKDISLTGTYIGVPATIKL